jgi:hypothetical protein
VQENQPRPSRRLDTSAAEAAARRAAELAKARKARVAKLQAARLAKERAARAKRARKNVWRQQRLDVGGADATADGSGGFDRQIAAAVALAVLGFALLIIAGAPASAVPRGALEIIDNHREHLVVAGAEVFMIVLLLVLVR